MGLFTFVFLFCFFSGQPSIFSVSAGRGGERKLLSWMEVRLKVWHIWQHIIGFALKPGLNFSITLVEVWWWFLFLRVVISAQAQNWLQIKKARRGHQK